MAKLLFFTCTSTSSETRLLYAVVAETSAGFAFMEPTQTQRDNPNMYVSWNYAPQLRRHHAWHLNNGSKPVKCKTQFNKLLREQGFTFSVADLKTELNRRGIET